MTWIFNAFYLTLLAFGSPWMLWRILKGKNRRGWSQKLFGSVTPPTLPPNYSRIWFHAVSVGEVNLLRPVLKQLLLANPELQVCISTTTESGFNLAQEKYPDHFVFFCPFDFSWAIKRALKRLRPDVLVLTELELWPNLISVTHDAQIPIAVINARLSEKSMTGYKRFGWLLGPVFKKLSLILCQNETYANRFGELSCENSRIVISGNVKFDGIQTDRENESTKRLVELCGISPNDRVFIAGSTQLDEDLMAARVFQKLAPMHPDLKLILVPRHPERVGTLVNQLDDLGISNRLRSRVDAWQERGTIGAREVIIVDVIGELGAWWGRADIAFVGGSFGNRGGQNMIEPAGYGVPVSFGPNTKNFRTTVEMLLNEKAARVVSNEAQLGNFVNWCLEHPDGACVMGARAQTTVLEHMGASKRTSDWLSKLMISRSEKSLDSRSTKAA